jgi:hypothetical protein
MSSTPDSRLRLRKAPALGLAVSALALSAGILPAQQAQPRGADSIPAPRFGSELLIPVASFVLPGLGQYIHGAPATGAVYTGVALGGLALTTVGDAWEDTWEDAPRRGRDQLADQGLHLMLTAGMISGWDAFHRAMPALQAQGRYQFIDRRESVGDLLSAPFDPSFLRRWTTWVDLAQTAVITALVLSERKSGSQYHAYRGRDALYATSLSMNAAAGEEALFRGYLLPMLYENTGGHFWVANGAQATLFGAGHIADAELAGVAFIAAWGLWEGWVTKRNDWSIRESIFHHFWYDVAIVTASLIVQEKDLAVRIYFPTIRF